MDRTAYHKGIISVLLTGFVIALLLLSGPVTALTVSVTQPNNADKGADVSFSISNEISDPDLLPIEYTDLIITGPNGFLKTCRINSDGTDDLEVTLDNIKFGTNAEITIKKLETGAKKIVEEEKKIAETETTKETGTTGEATKGTGWLWVTILVIIVLVTVGYYVFKKK